MQSDDMLIDEAISGSFPASDPPCWTATHGGTPAEPYQGLAPRREIQSWIEGDIAKLELEHVASIFCRAHHVVSHVPVGANRHIHNIEAWLPGVAHQDEDEVIVGAHVARDERHAASGALLLAVARVLARRRFARTVRLVAFVDDGTAARAGSRDYARRLRRSETPIAGMIGLNGLGSEREEVHFVSNMASRPLLASACAAFERGCDVPARGLVVPGFLPVMNASDHRSFWKAGFPAVLLTDVGTLVPRRWRGDAAQRVNAEKLARMVPGIIAVVAKLAGRPADALTV